MLTLEQEAENANGYALYGKPLGEKYLAFNEGFIVGANSKHVQAKIIQAQLDVLNAFYYGEDLEDKDVLDFYANMLETEKHDLTEQLKELENEE